MPKPMVDIILPSFNGERFIAEQIDSILSQTYSHWRLIIRDDGSKDATVRIIKNYSKRYPDKIYLIEDDKGNLGVANNVLQIMSYVKSKYIMLCDQDDIWLPEKVKSLLQRIIAAEKKHPMIPILIHSNAKVTDHDLKVTYSSLHHIAKMDNNKTAFPNILQRNIVQGASAIFNYELLEKAQKVVGSGVKKTMYHDWWLALIASAFGRIYYCDRPLMLYRQHERNLVGAERLVIRYNNISQYMKEYLGVFKNIHYLHIDLAMTEMFYKLYRSDITEYQKKILLHFKTNPSDYKEFIKLGLYKNYDRADLVLRFIFGVQKVI